MLLLQQQQKKKKSRKKKTLLFRANKSNNRVMAFLYAELLAAKHYNLSTHEFKALEQEGDNGWPAATE